LKYNLIVDEVSKVKVYKPVTKSNKNQGRYHISGKAILKAKFLKDQKIVGLTYEGCITTYLWWPHAHELNPGTPFTCGAEKEKKYNNKTHGKLIW
jgi:hypothetical protein